MAVVESTPKKADMEKWRHSKAAKTMLKMPLNAWRMGWKKSLPATFACITTSGRKSGLPRHTMVDHYEIEGNYYIISGWQNKSDWVKNLLADPRITLQPARGEAVAGMARPISDDAKLSRLFTGMQENPMMEAWLESLGIQPEVTDFLAKKDQLYIFEVTPTGEMQLPPLTEDLRWVNSLILGIAGSVVMVVVLSLLLRKKMEKRLPVETV